MLLFIRLGYEEYIMPASSATVHTLSQVLTQMQRINSSLSRTYDHSQPPQIVLEENPRPHLQISILPDDTSITPYPTQPEGDSK